MLKAQSLDESLLCCLWKHQPPSSIEGEATRIISDNMFDFYCITPWLDNIVDVIDVRDTASLLMVERYLSGLYCLSTDYMPGMDMRVYKKLSSVSIAKRNTTVKLYQLLRNFQPDNMTELEKRIFISDISEIILAYIFYHEHNEFCLKHISMDTHRIIHKILENAHKIAQKVVEKAEKRSLISRECGSLNITKMFETCMQDVLPSENCLLLLQNILDKAILCLIQVIDVQE
ncbi:uncharacterized protein LOC114880914 [Osmia bicornis bicornis]|uniref:uncharacterized protein LOC114880914 n=1 Tax=Osmia bicornis bicornis TaxID=1437191 RepID=UPI0010F96E68|nr:uncharacterized protein LOC114880914 [Osmia bicornis bicornis]